MLDFVHRVKSSAIQQLSGGRDIGRVGRIEGKKNDDDNCRRMRKSYLQDELLNNMISISVPRAMGT